MLKSEYYFTSSSGGQHRLLHESTRPLYGQEQELLREIVADCKRRISNLPLRALFPFLLVGVIASVFMMWAGPYLAVLAGTVISGIITFCICKSERCNILPILRRYEGALDHNQAYEWRIQSNEVVGIDGHCYGDLYAFQADELQIVLVVDPEDYNDESSDFPSNDFSIVSILDNDGKGIVNGLIYNHGRKLEPLRQIPWKRFSKLRHLDHTEVIRGKLGDLEQLLRK
jgi:hypothetical protein